MSASATNKKQCVTCNKSGGILICDGCQQAFCGKHVIEHRQELAGQLENIMQEHDLLQQDLLQPSSKKDALLERIDKWEKYSIANIQTAAETARTTLKELIEQSKERLAKKFPDIAESLRASREADDFSEHDLDKWRKELKELATQLKSSSLAKLTPDKNEPLYLMKLQIKDAASNQSTSKNSSSPSPSPCTASLTTTSCTPLREAFFESSRSVLIEDDGSRVTHVGLASSSTCIRGRLLYSDGSHMIRIKLEKFQEPYHIFFGCMSSKVALQEDVFRSSSSVGWFGYNQVYEHGSCSCNSKVHGHNSGKIKANDVLRLTFDCDRKQILLFNERSNQTNIINVNIDKTPYPWQLLVVLSRSGDCVRVLNDA